MIFHGSKPGVLVHGNYKPAEWYRGSIKKAGFTVQEATGEGSVVLDVTYNDSAELTIVRNGNDNISLVTQGKNFWDMYKLKSTNHFTVNADKSITINANAYLCNTEKTLSQICPELKVGKTYILSFETDGSNFIYIVGDSGVWTNNSVKTITQDMLNGTVILYGAPATSPDYNLPHTIKHFQIELGDKVTSYQPYYAPQEVDIPIDIADDEQILVELNTVPLGTSVIQTDDGLPATLTLKAKVADMTSTTTTYSDIMSEPKMSDLEDGESETSDI